jgi:hypothetical protein
MKLLIKLAVAALLANAVYRVGSEYLTYIKFRDAVRDVAMHKAATDEDLKRQVMDLANAFDVPLDEDDLSIKRRERRVVVEGRYEKPIEVLPTVKYPWPFSWTIDAIVSSQVPLVPRRR